MSAQPVAGDFLAAGDEHVAAAAASCGELPNRGSALAFTSSAGWLRQ